MKQRQRILEGVKKSYIWRLLNISDILIWSIMLNLCLPRLLLQTCLPLLKWWFSTWKPWFSNFQKVLAVNQNQNLTFYSNLVLKCGVQLPCYVNLSCKYLENLRLKSCFLPLFCNTEASPITYRVCFLSNFFFSLSKFKCCWDSGFLVLSSWNVGFWSPFHRVAALGTFPGKISLFIFALNAA